MIFLVGVKGFIESRLPAGGDLFCVLLLPEEKREPLGENLFERVGDPQEYVMVGEAAMLKEASCICRARIRLCGGVARGLDWGGGRSVFSLLSKT